MSRWEYRRGINLDNDQLANLGTSGWELVSVIGPVARFAALGSDVKGLSVKNDVVENAIVFFFKRPQTQAV